MNIIRKELFNKSKRIVIKIGSQVLTDENKSLDQIRIARIVEQIAKLTNTYKKQIILVSSGAISAGMGKLNIKKRPANLPDVQALAAVGQSFLIESYRREFNKYGIEIGQILVTKEDFQNRNRYLNMSNTLAALLKRNIIPVFNENDTVATREITLGDNDQLCTLVSHSVHADLVVILSNQEGFLDMENNGTLIPLITKIDKKILQKVSNTKSQAGVGGMQSKIGAVKQLITSGEPVILACGKKENVLFEIFEKDVGSLFLSSETKLKRKKRWIAFSAKPSGELIIDEGAKNALAQNRSLLAIGIKNVIGDFNKGSTVKIIHNNIEVARGLVNYGSEEIHAIKGHKSSEFEKLIGDFSDEEIIHKNNLVITKD